LTEIKAIMEVVRGLIDLGSKTNHKIIREGKNNLERVEQTKIVPS
jgi:hypothetical protein